MLDTTAEASYTLDMTTGQEFTAEIRRSFRIAPRTRDHRDGRSLKTDILESIANAVQYPGYYGEHRTELSRAAWGTYLSYDKHVNGYRIDGTLRYHIDQMSPYRFAAFLGQMIDAGVTNTGEGERFFSTMSRKSVA